MLRCLTAQIEPADTVSVPVPATAQEAHSEPAAAASAPTDTFVRGWSFSSEVDEGSIRPGKSVTLDPGHSEIILFFDSHTNRPDVEFRYRLDGYDANWTVTRGRTAHYRRLTPGTYSFEVESRIQGQAWPNHKSLLVIQQKPFFYQTWYAYLLITLLVLALAVHLLHQRDQLLKGQIGIVLQERNRIASECHDTLMAGFAAISWQLEATAKLFRDAGEGASPTAQSFELARSMVTHCQAEARRIIWDLRDADAITDKLSGALADALSAHRLRDAIEMALEVQGEEISISPGAVHHLVCIGQEAVTNAIRHSGSATVQVDLRYGSDALILSVRDEGKGFSPSGASPLSGHFGIAVMEERARKLGALLRVTSSPGHGTLVSLTVGFHRIHQPTFQQHHIVPWIGV